MTRTEVSQLLREQLRTGALTQAHAARLAGVTKQAVHAYANGGNTLSFENELKVLEHLGYRLELTAAACP